MEIDAKSNNSKVINEPLKAITVEGRSDILKKICHLLFWLNAFGYLLVNQYCTRIGLILHIVIRAIP